MQDQEQKNRAALNSVNGARRSDAFDDLKTQPMHIQFGPSHPATHGTVKIDLDLEGERVVDADVQVGYLHRGFEKECETGFFYQNIPYTDRLNYSSPILNNVGYCLAVEKLFDIKTPPRCDYIRVIGGEWCLDSFAKSGDAERTLLNRGRLHPLGAWYHAAMVYDGREFRNYVNGVLEGAGPLHLTPQGPSPTLPSA